MLIRGFDVGENKNYRDQMTALNFQCMEGHIRIAIHFLHLSCIKAYIDCP